MGKIIDYNDEIMRYEEKILKGYCKDKKKMLKHYEKLKAWRFMDVMNMI